MTEYGQYFATHNSPAPLLSHDPIKERKEARRKILEAVWQRRRENYRRFYAKMAFRQPK